MGYRLEVTECEYKGEFSFGKLFGYVADEKQLRCWKWLLKNGHIDGDECWTYGYNPQIILKPKEFKEFMELYVQDWEEYTGISFGNEYLKEAIENENYKLLEWY